MKVDLIVILILAIQHWYGGGGGNIKTGKFLEGSTNNLGDCSDVNQKSEPEQWNYSGTVFELQSADRRRRDR